MKILDLTFGTPEENLACDETLMKSDDFKGGILRFWEPQNYFVVLGYSRKWRADVNSNYCAKNDIPVLRRISGGGTVLQGPGCLNFSLILNTNGPHPLSTITKTNAYILNRHKEALQAITGRKIDVRGVSDLTIEDMKFSGNSQRREKDRMLFQGSFLLSADLSMIEKALTIPDRQPSYRQKRSHQEFLVNIGTGVRQIKQAIAEEWKATSPLKKIPTEEIRALAGEKIFLRRVESEILIGPTHKS